jgi:hypothetical protein
VYWYFAAGLRQVASDPLLFSREEKVGQQTRQLAPEQILPRGAGLSFYIHCCDEV